MKVLLTKKFMQSDIDYISKGLIAGVELVEPDEFSESGVLAKIDVVDALLGGLVTEKILKQSPHIKLIQIPWTGVDNLSFELLAKYPSTVLCNSHSNSFVVAEHAVALYLSVAKKVAYHDQQMRTGNWNRVSSDGNPVSPFSSAVVNRKVVFVGYGSVNQTICKLLSGFNPNVTVVNRSGLLNEAGIEAKVFGFQKIQEAVEGAEAVFIAAPLTTETRGIIDESCFTAMNERTILINVARGALVNERSLYEALRSNRIFGAGIDTWYNYPKSQEQTTYPSVEYPFQELDNLVMSPHRAGYTDEGFPHLDDAIVNLNNLKTGKPLMNKVSVSRRY